MRKQKRERVGVSRVRLAKFEYLSALQLVEINNRVLKETRARKADSHRVASRTKLDAIIGDVRTLDGDAFAKAACLLTGLTRRHAFDSGNRRTAYAATKLFLEANGKDDGGPARPPGSHWHS
jgi:prophage maintenance system killer protein